MVKDHDRSSTSQQHEDILFTVEVTSIKQDVSATDVEKQKQGQSVDRTKKSQEMGGRCNEETKRLRKKMKSY